MHDADYVLYNECYFSSYSMGRSKELLIKTLFSFGAWCLFTNCKNRNKFLYIEHLGQVLYKIIDNRPLFKSFINHLFSEFVVYYE